MPNTRLWEYVPRELHAIILCALTLLGVVAHRHFTITGNDASRGVTTICTFTKGPRSGLAVDFSSFGIAPMPIGSTCTDESGSQGVAGVDMPSTWGVTLGWLLLIGRLLGSTVAVAAVLAIALSDRYRARDRCWAFATVGVLAGFWLTL